MKRLNAKPRYRGLDYLPHDADQWEALPAQVEQAYRRGYTQGFLAAACLAAEGITPAELRDFGYGKLWRWRGQSPLRWGRPPQFVRKAKR